MGGQGLTDKSTSIMFISIFLVGLGFSIIIPVLPYYAEQMNASAFQVGMLITVYALCQFIFSPIWGAYSDKVGRKPVLLMSVFGFALTFIMFGMANSLLMLFIARIAGGIFSCAAIPTAMAYIADSTTLEKRGASMGLIGASMGMGMIFGPAIGGVLSSVSLSFPFFFAGALALVNALGVFFFLNESLEPEKRTATVAIMRAPILEGLKTPLAVLFVVMLLSSVAESIHHGTFALFAEAKLGLVASQIGWAFAAAGVVSVIVQGFVVGRAMKQLGEEKTAAIGLCLSVLSFTLFLFSFNLASVVAFMAVFSAGAGLIRPSISAAISKRTTLQQGMAMGMLQGYDSLGRVIGPALGGLMLDINLRYGYFTAITAGTAAFLFLLISRYKDNRKNVITE